MLQMDCSQCEGQIRSPHLAEVQLFQCPHCGKIIVVENVVIADQKSSTRLVSSLKKCLSSAREKFLVNKASRSDLKIKYEIDRRLAKYLRRGDFRLNLAHEILVDVAFDHHNKPARLLNISSTGAAIEFLDLAPAPEEGSETRLQLPLSGANDAPLMGRVVWSGKLARAGASPSITLGLQFLDIDEGTRTRLWTFIVDNETATHVPRSEP